VFSPLTIVNNLNLYDMKNLTPEQVANFAYWMSEHSDLRIPKHIQELPGKVRIAYIEHELLPEFLRKYPNGILTGWAK
jgi:hypothetical protein